MKELERHMEELGRYEIALVRTYYRGCRVIAAVDVETGEIILEKPEREQVGTGSPETPFSYLFAEGQNAARREVLFGREVLGDGRQCIYITDYDADPPVLLGCFWLGKQERVGKRGTYHTGGKPSYARVYFDALVRRIGERDLPDQTAGLLIKMLPYVRRKEGNLVHPRTKRPLTFSALADAVGCPRQTLARRIGELKTAGIIRDNPDGPGYVLSREFIAKG